MTRLYLSRVVLCILLLLLINGYQIWPGKNAETFEAPDHQPEDCGQSPGQDGRHPGPESEGPKTPNEPKDSEKKNKPWLHQLYDVSYLFFACLTCLLSQVLIAYSIYVIVQVLRVTADKSGLVVALFFILICAVATIAIIVYAAYFAFKKKPEYIFATLLLLIPLIIQAALAGTVVDFSVNDEKDLFHSLANLFTLSRSYQTEYAGKYHKLEYEYKCCGLYDPSDYKLIYFDHYHPPDVPIACCPAYNPWKPEDHQEEARALCMQERTFYSKGCKDRVINTVKNVLHTLQDLTWPVLACDVVLMLITLSAFLLGKNPERLKRELEEKEKKAKAELEKAIKP